MVLPLMVVLNFFSAMVYRPWPRYCFFRESFGLRVFRGLPSLRLPNVVLVDPVDALDFAAMVRSY